MTILEAIEKMINDQCIEGKPPEAVYVGHQEGIELVTDPRFRWMNPKGPKYGVSVWGYPVVKVNRKTYLRVV